jgi:hypothetical protein
MRVKDLIKALQAHDPEQRIVVDGYEGGFNDIEDLEVTKIKPNPSAAWYDGQYDYVREDEPGETVVYIPR